MNSKLIKVGIILAVIIAIVVISKVIYNLAKKKKELAKFNGYTKEEFKAKLQEAWKKRFFETQYNALATPEEWAAEWRKGIDASLKAGESLEDAIYHAVQYSWAYDKPKAWDTPWTQAWLNTYIQTDLGLDPSDPEIKEVASQI